jgi:peptide/nickel transport system substrate-binding protein
MSGLKLGRLRSMLGGALHPAVRPLAEQATRGEIGRREFLRTAAFLGVTAASAKAFVGDLGLVGEAVAQGAPKQGGTLRFACSVMEMKDPALVTWAEPSNLYRNSLEFLAEVDADNVTQPYLAEGWKPSDDLKTWTFKLRPGVKWSNGDDFTVEDVEFNFKRWQAPDSKSPNKTSFAMVTKFEKLSDLEFRLTLDRAVLAIPEMLYAYTCPILHRKFDEMGSDWIKNPIGTGPFQMTEYKVSSIAKFKRRDGYWGKPAFLDEIQYIDLGTDIAAHVAALAAGQVDVLYRVTIAEIELVEKLPNVRLLRGKAAQTVVMRMQVDQKPFDDIRVRQAVCLAADNQKMLELAYRNRGVVGENHHVAPFQPEYFKLPPLKRDVAKAKALLAEAGYKDGIDLELVVGNTQGKWEQDASQVLQQALAEAGIRLKLNVMPAAQYWPIWDKVPFGVTFWAHRPLAVMTLDLAYRSGASWNESHFSDKNFDAALDKAMGIVNPRERSQAMEQVEKILQESCVIVQPFWADKFAAVSAKVNNHRPHPADYFRMDRVWMT